MKNILAEHFDRSPVKTAEFTQYYQGEYWAPKHQDSLSFFIEKVESDLQPAWEKSRDKMEKVSACIQSAISELEEADREIEDELY